LLARKKMNLSKTTKFKKHLNLSNPNYKKSNKKDEITVTIETKKVCKLLFEKKKTVMHNALSKIIHKQF
jgi:hypothetical protein